MLIISTPYFISRYLFSDPGTSTPPGTEVSIYSQKKPPKIKEWLTAHGLLPRPERFYDPEYLEEIRQQAAKTDRILLFGLERLKDIMILRRIFPTHKMAVFFWNPVCSLRNNRAKAFLYLKHLGLLGIKAVTFDPGDAHRYGMLEVNQTFIFGDKTFHPSSTDIEGDLFFVGKDKGRASRITGFYRRMCDAGLECLFYISKDKESLPVPGFEHLYHDRQMEYTETLRRVSRHKAYIEVRQEGQKGMTLRPLEALAAGRKLLTDNKDIVNWDLYHPSRVMVVDYDTTDAADIKRFLDIPYQAPTEHEVRPYQLPVWLDRLQTTLWNNEKQ